MADRLPNPPIPGLDPDANSAGPAVGVAIFVIILTPTIMSARFTARIIAPPGIGLDDWLMLWAAVCLVAFAAVTIYLADNLYLGQHVAKVPLPEINHYLRFQYFYSISAQNTLGFMKLSLTALYWRIFKTSVIRIPIIVMAVLVSMWTICYLLVNIFWCVPVHAFWNLQLQMEPSTKCVQPAPEVLGNTISDLILDASLLVLPLFAIAQLQMSLAKKIGCGGLFFLGILTTIAAGLRLWRSLEVFRLPGVDPLYTAPGVIIWIMLEGALGVATASLPTLRPLFRLARTGSAARPSAAAQYAKNWSGRTDSSAYSRSKGSGAKGSVSGGLREDWVLPKRDYVRGGGLASHSSRDPYRHMSHGDEEKQIQMDVNSRSSMF